MRNIKTTTPCEIEKTDGQTVTVQIQTLRLKDFPALLSAMPADICTQAELFTGNKSGWAQTVDDASLLKLVDEGQKANKDFFGQWLAVVRAQGDSLKAPAPAAPAAA